MTCVIIHSLWRVQLRTPSRFPHKKHHCRTESWPTFWIKLDLDDSNQFHLITWRNINTDYTSEISLDVMVSSDLPHSTTKASQATNKYRTPNPGQKWTYALLNWKRIMSWTTNLANHPEPVRS